MAYFISSRNQPTEERLSRASSKGRKPCLPACSRRSPPMKCRFSFKGRPHDRTHAHTPEEIHAVRGAGHSSPTFPGVSGIPFRKPQPLWRRFPHLFRRVIRFLTFPLVAVLGVPSPQKTTFRRKAKGTTTPRELCGLIPHARSAGWVLKSHSLLATCCPK